MQGSMQDLKEKEDGTQRLCSKAGAKEAEGSCWMWSEMAAPEVFWSQSHWNAWFASVFPCVFNRPMKISTKVRSPVILVPMKENEPAGDLWTFRHVKMSPRVTFGHSDMFLDLSCLRVCDGSCVGTCM